MRAHASPETPVARWQKQERAQGEGRVEQAAAALCSSMGKRPPAAGFCLSLSRPRRALFVSRSPLFRSSRSGDGTIRAFRTLELYRGCSFEPRPSGDALRFHRERRDRPPPPPAPPPPLPSMRARRRLFSTSRALSLSRHETRNVCFDALKPKSNPARLRFLLASRDQKKEKDPRAARDQGKAADRRLFLSLTSSTFSLFLSPPPQNKTSSFSLSVRPPP